MVEASSGRAVGQPKYRLFGLTLASGYPFESRLGKGSGAPDISFASAGCAPFAARLAEPVYVSPLVDEAGDSLACLYRLAVGELLRFGDALDFYLGEASIDCHLRDPRRAELVEIRLLGPVLAYWLERSSIRALHASAVVADGRAVAFMATNRGGKSGLAAAMMQGGAALLSDDLLPLERLRTGWVAHPGYPQMRMLPDGLEQFVAEPETRRAAPLHMGKHWLPVGAGGFGSFHPAVAPLARVYLPERLEPGSPSTEVSIADLPPRQAVIELLRCSFSPYIVEAVGLQPERLESFARLAQEVPVRRLSYPSGFDQLPRVQAAVLADLERG